MADDKQFFDEEQKAQEEIEKIKLGEAEYEPKELESALEKAKKVDEYEKKYNTDFDKAWSSYGKTTQENKRLQEELEQVKQQAQTRDQVQAPGELSDAQIQQAREQARKIGIATMGDLDEWYSSRRAAEKLLEECGSLEGEITGEDGRPKFSTEEMLAHMQETGIKSPMKAYKDKYESELDSWKASELNKEKSSSLPTLNTGGGARSPKSVPVTKANLDSLVHEALFGAGQNE